LLFARGAGALAAAREGIRRGAGFAEEACAREPETGEAGGSAVYTTRGFVAPRRFGALVF
jgi:hypothetical protein